MKNKHIENLYLHAGMSKTATSSIQDTLFANRDLLEKNDYFYSSNLPRNHSDVFRMLFSDAPEKHHTSVKHQLTLEKIQAINIQNTETIRHELSNTPCHNVIYSAEIIASFEIQELKKLKVFFEKLAPSANIHVIVSTRNPMDFINSAVQQKRRTAVGTKVNFKHVAKLQKILSVFGKTNIIAYKFEDACLNKLGPVGHFLSCIEISKNVVRDIDIINSNSSISDKAIDIIDFINQALPMLDANGISDGRIHLDYAHFYGLTGGKFQLGRDYYDANVDMEKLSNSYQWFKDNMGINYAMKEIPDESPPIVYDSVFCEEMKQLYVFLTPVQKKLTQEYAKNKIQAANADRTSLKNLNQLLGWMTEHQKTAKNYSLLDTIELQREMTSSDSKHRQQLLKRFEGGDIRPGQFLRDVALFLEHYQMIEESEFFMRRAKMYAPNVALIDRKLEEYKSVSKNVTNPANNEEYSHVGIDALPPKVLSSDNKYRNQLLKRLKATEILPGSFFRDIALFLEHYEMIDKSHYFMTRANVYSQNATQIEDKIDEYAAILKNAKPSTLDLVSNHTIRLIKRLLRRDH